MNPEFLNYVRTLSKADKKTLSQKALKTVEEVGELAKVVLPFDNAYATTHRFVERESILEESMDTILCALSVAYDLDFTDDEIQVMLQRKAEKWAGLQSKEKDINQPLPFEIHITVTLKNTDSAINDFKTVCRMYNVKPIIIDLQSNTGTSVMVDVMTSSKHYGTNRSALAEAQRISDALTVNDFLVVRKKIETVPWHPAAPKFRSDIMPPNCYFESHIGVRLPSDIETTRFRAVCANRSELHISQNTFKRYEDGESVVMATYRMFEGNADKFNRKVALHVLFLNDCGFKTEKPITEFAVYDTKVSHDESWLLTP